MVAQRSNFALHTGGSFGRITVTVRTVGGGESWDNTVLVDTEGDDTIDQVLASRQPGRIAVAGQDYQILDQEVIFQVRTTFHL